MIEKNESKILTPEVKRGQVWWIRDPYSVGAEEALGRPGVIVSSERGNKTSPAVNMIYCTSRPRAMSHTPTFRINGVMSTLMCDQIITVDKTRLTRYVTTIPDTVMREVDNGLRTVLGLDIVDPRREREVVELKEKLERNESALVDAQIECAVHKRMYEVTLEKLVSLRLEKDIEKPTPVEVEPVPVAEVVEKPNVEVAENPTPVEVELVDINRCSFDTLRSIGFSINIALNTIAARPFLEKDDLRAVPGMTQMGYRLLAPKITVGDTTEYRKPATPKIRTKSSPAVKSAPVQDKVNVNTATLGELVSVARLSEKTAKCIVAYRNTHGKFTAVEDLLNVSRFGKGCLAKYGDLLTV